MKGILLFIAFAILITSCEETEYPYKFPKPYFPAYPESYWVYSNGTTVKVDPGYFKHQYYAELASARPTDYYYVPRIDNQYVYEYMITQNSTLVPLKEFLSTTKTDPWTVDYWEGLKIQRQIESFDTTIILTKGIGPENKTDFDSVILVIEYMEDTVVHPWIKREAYAPNIGLIRSEINLSDTSVVPHIEKELVRYFINY